MERDSLPPEKRPRGRKKEVREYMTLEIADQDRFPGCPIHPAKQLDDFGILEMVETKSKLCSANGRRKASATTFGLGAAERFTAL